MATTVIDSTNQIEFAATGEVKAEEKPPEAKVEKVEAKVEKVDEGAEDEGLSDKVRKIIGKKHRAMKEAEEFAESEYRARRQAEKRAEELEARLKEQESKAPPKEDVEPQRADFESDEKYWEAKIDWRAQQAVKADRALRAKDEAEQQAKAAEEAFRERLKHSAEAIPDYAEAVEEAAVREDVVAPHIVQYIRESDDPASLLYHFAKHPDELAHLNSISPIKAIAQIGKLEIALAKPGEKPVAAPPAIEKSRAPEPIAPISSGPATVHKELKDWTVKDHIEAEKAERKAALTERRRH